MHSPTHLSGSMRSICYGEPGVILEGDGSQLMSLVVRSESWEGTATGVFVVEKAGKQASTDRAPRLGLLSANWTPRDK